MKTIVYFLTSLEHTFLLKNWEIYQLFYSIIFKIITFETLQIFRNFTVIFKLFINHIFLGTTYGYL